jgi:DNA-binding NtrC family response regulator
MRQVVAMMLSDLDAQIFEAADGVEALALFERETIHLILTDLKLPRLGGMEVLDQIKARAPETPVIIMTAYGSIDNAIEAIRHGAFDYVTKPFKEERLRSCVHKALRISRLTSEVRYLREEVEGRYAFANIIGASPRLRESMRLAGEVSRTDTTVLLSGESGTGKELFSRAIHINSPRASGPFLPVNCAAIPSGLLEAELFGHERGAFTGAVQRKKGRFELASGGTLFLDEISDMELGVQAKLLRVIESRQFERLGGDKSIRADVRLIAATNRDLARMVEEGRFREDLYYRINVFPIRLPPLRDRREDIEPLCEFFLRDFGRAFGRKTPTLAARALDKLCGHPWRGNVRELRNVLERAVILAGDEQQIASRHIILDQTQEAAIGSVSLEQVLAKAIRERGINLEEIERACIRQAMACSGDNVSRAARRLGLSRATLRYRLERLGQ